MEMFRKIAFLITMVLFGVLISSSVASAQASPVLVASPNHDWVDGYDWPEGVTIDLYIDDDADLGNGSLFHVSGEIGAGEHWINFELGTVFNIQAGHLVTMTDGTTTKILLVSNLEVTNVDPETDTVSGTADSGSEVHVWIEGCGDPCDVRVTADSGTWLVDFPDGTLVPGTWYPAEQENEDGDRTQVPWLVSNPRFDTNVTGNWVGANEFPTSTEVTVSVYEADLTTLRFDDTQSTDQFGNAWFDFWALGLGPLEPRNFVVVNAGTFTKDLVIADLTLDVFDPETDEIFGTAPLGATVRVDVCAGDDCESLTVSPDSSGNWIADAWSIDVTPNAWYAAFITDADGDSTMAELSPPTPMPFLEVNITGGGGWVRANDLWEYDEVAIAVFESEGSDDVKCSGTLGVDENGSVELNCWESGIESYDYVELSEGAEVIKELLVLPLTLDIFDPDADLISGTALAGETVRVDACNVIGPDEWDCRSEEDIAESGTWSITFADFLDSETWYAAFITDEDGDATMAEVSPPPAGPGFAVVMSHNEVHAYAWPLGSIVTLKIDDPSNGIGVDYFDVQPSIEASWDEPGQTWAQFQINDEFEIMPGYVVTVSDGTTPKSHTVTSLTLDGVDSATDEVYGTAFPSTWVQLWIGEDPGANFNILANEVTGFWSVDFTGTYDFGPGNSIYVAQHDDDGDSTRFDYQEAKPFFEANITHEWIDFFEFPRGASIYVEISGSEGLKFEGEVTEEYDGYAHLELWEVGTEIDPGDSIVVTYDGVDKELLLVDLTLDVFDIADGDAQLEGKAPELAIVFVVVCNPPLDEMPEPDCIVGDANRPGGADWSIGFSPSFEISPEAGAWVYVYDIDGDATMAVLDDEPAPQASFIVFPEYDFVQGFGWQEGEEVTLIVDNDINPDNGYLLMTTGIATLGEWGVSVDFNLGIDIQSGYRVVMFGGDFFKMHDVTDLSVTAINPDNDTVSGTALPGSAVNLWVNWTPGTDIMTSADDDGNWIGQFAYDLVPGTGGIAAQFDDEGDGTFVEWWIPFDEDGDGIPDELDNCPLMPNPDQADFDSDGMGDVCDPDDDDDGVLDTGDNCPVAYNPAQVDTDIDGLGDVCDPDDDDDGVHDGTDNCPFTPNTYQADFDGDGIGDACDPDDDDDGIPDGGDLCPLEDATGFDADVDGCIDTHEGLLQIIDTYEDEDISDRIKNSLASKVENALKSLDKGRENAAIGQLEAFINQGEAQRGKKISDETADLLISYAVNLISQIEGG
jgi:hypothetical protein